MNYNYLNNWYEEVQKKLGEKAKPFKVIFSEPVGKNDAIVDMHGHTTVSDGKRPSDFYHEKLAETAHNYSKTGRDIFGYKEKQDSSTHLLGTADHDNIGKKYDKNGMEVTCKLDENMIEILVYNCNQEKARALVESGKFPYLDRNFRVNRILTLLEKRLKLVNDKHLTDQPLTFNDFVSIEIEKNKDDPATKTFAEVGLDFDTVFSGGKQFPEYVKLNNEMFKINYDYFYKKFYKYISNSNNGQKYLKSIAENDPDFDPASYSDFLRYEISSPYGDIYVDDNKYWPTAQDVIDFAKEVDGIAVLAHPFSYNAIDYTPLELMKKATSMGIDGVEAFHGFNEPDEVEFIYKFAQTHDLLITMGSDTHEYYSYQGGISEPGIAPGRGVQSRFGKDNPIDETYLGTYNLHYFGTGAWRGEKEYDPDSLPESVITHLVNIKKKIDTRKEKNEQIQAKQRQ